MKRARDQSVLDDGRDRYDRRASSKGRHGDLDTCSWYASCLNKAAFFSFLSVAVGAVRTAAARAIDGRRGWPLAGPGDAGATAARKMDAHLVRKKKTRAMSAPMPPLASASADTLTDVDVAETSTDDDDVASANVAFAVAMDSGTRLVRIAKSGELVEAHYPDLLDGALCAALVGAYEASRLPLQQQFHMVGGIYVPFGRLNFMSAYATGKTLFHGSQPEQGSKHCLKGGFAVSAFLEDLPELRKLVEATLRSDALRRWDWSAAKDRLCVQLNVYRGHALAHKNEGIDFHSDGDSVSLEYPIVHAYVKNGGKAGLRLNERLRSRRGGIEFEVAQGGCTVLMPGADRQVQHSRRCPTLIEGQVAISVIIRVLHELRGTRCAPDAVRRLAEQPRLDLLGIRFDPAHPSASRIHHSRVVCGGRVRKDVHARALLRANEEFGVKLTGTSQSEDVWLPGDTFVHPKATVLLGLEPHSFSGAVKGNGRDGAVYLFFSRAFVKPEYGPYVTRGHIGARTRSAAHTHTRRFWFLAERIRHTPNSLYMRVAHEKRTSVRCFGPITWRGESPTTIAYLGNCRVMGQGNDKFEWLLEMEVDADPTHAEYYFAGGLTEQQKVLAAWMASCAEEEAQCGIRS
uniref:Uncharacterized protein n=1 Tax=Prasinoderma coloniale TaxID=156133 RepID=A0A7R9TMX5_9VIRI|mmetsp:Transcript_3076/g.12468  ORF Transcript_3076/g.12468 Transcript_3076/m.12468 type:complete len:629 (+) Transcript_3076:191-2077(+)